MQWHYIMAGGAGPMELVMALAMYLNPQEGSAPGGQSQAAQYDSDDMDLSQ